MVEALRKNIGSYVVTQTPEGINAKIYLFGMGDAQKILSCFSEGVAQMAMEGTLQKKLGLSGQLFSVAVPASELEEGLAQLSQSHPVSARLPIDAPEEAVKMLVQLNEMSKSAGINQSGLMI